MHPSCRGLQSPPEHSTYAHDYLGGAGTFLGLSVGAFMLADVFELANIWMPELHPIFSSVHSSFWSHFFCLRASRPLLRDISTGCCANGPLLSGCFKSCLPKADTTPALKSSPICLRVRPSGGSIIRTGEVACILWCLPQITGLNNNRDIELNMHRLFSCIQLGI